jgi:hypothetical protein
VRYEDYYGSHLLRFIPEKSGVYIIASYATEESGIDPRVDVHYEKAPGDIRYFAFGRNENGLNFFVELELTKGEIYYFVFYSENLHEEFPINFYLDTHVHSGGVQDCKGYLCDCGKYYGEGGDHTPTGEMTCLGSLCSVCEEYFGDATEHNKIGDLTCSGYFCDKCEMYQGEGDGVSHIWNPIFGDCDICETKCPHDETDDGGVCLECDYLFEFMIVTGENVVFCDGFNEATRLAEEGSLIKLLRDIVERDVHFDKEVTFDLSGYSIITPSSDAIYVGSNVKFIDSVGGGFINLALVLRSPVVLEGGGFFVIIIDTLKETFIHIYIKTFSK